MTPTLIARNAGGAPIFFLLVNSLPSPWSFTSLAISVILSAMCHSLRHFWYRYSGQCWRDFVYCHERFISVLWIVYASADLETYLGADNNSIGCAETSVVTLRSIFCLSSCILVTLQHLDQSCSLYLVSLCRIIKGDRKSVV